MIKYFLDTSYLLPYARIKVDDWTENDLLKLLHDSNLELYYSSLSIIELMAKGFKLVNMNENLNLKDIKEGIDAILHETRLIQIPFNNDFEIMKLALEFRSIHSDYYDCMLLASSIRKKLIFCTYDKTLLKKISRNKKIGEIIQSTYNEFKFLLKNLNNPPKLFRDY